MRQLRPKYRFLQFSLRSALIGTTVLALLFSYLGDAIRSYNREQYVFLQILDLHIDSNNLDSYIPNSGVFTQIPDVPLPSTRIVLPIFI